MTQNTAAELRVRLKAARNRLDVADRQRDSSLIRSHLHTWLNSARDHWQVNGKMSQPIIAAFWPLPDEPDLVPLISLWAKSGLTVALPRMPAKDQPLQFHRWHVDMTLIPGSFGVMEPPESAALQPHVMLVPTLGFTIDGDRLGYGQGFYDRTLAYFKANKHFPTTIGVAWDCGDIHAVPSQYSPQPHDQRLDAIVTPKAWRLEPPKLVALGYNVD